MPSEWISAKGDFREADVICWTEAIWAPNRRRKQKKPWGSQEVTGQIIATSGDYVSIKVIKSAIKDAHIGVELKPHKVGTVIRKKRATLLKGDLKRMPWSDESARAALLPR